MRMWKLGLLVSLASFCSAWGATSVVVSTPGNGSTVNSPVHFYATSSSACAKGVSAMGIYTAPNVLAYEVKGATLDTSLTLKAGTYHMVIQEWDNCNGASTIPVTITVAMGSGVNVSTPATNSAVVSPVHYVATAASSCDKGVAAMGVYTAPNQLAYTVAGSSLDAKVALNPGRYNTVVQSWDNCGSSSTTPISVSVTSAVSQPGVQVALPAGNSTVSSPVHFVASATTSCAQGVAAMGIYTASDALAYSANGATLDTNLNLNPGTYHTVVQEWDQCKGSSSTPVTITVAGTSNGGGGGSSGGKTFYNLERQTWTGNALLRPSYNMSGICDTGKLPQDTCSWAPGVGSPSGSGTATKTTIGGKSAPGYEDVLWNNHLIGDYSSQGLPDGSRTLAPSLHDFTYDLYFWVPGSVETSWALEFDINQFVDGKSYIWGHECRVAGGHKWDTWSNQGKHWVVSDIDCNPVSNAWNHLILHVHRTSDNHLVFDSITLNGYTASANRTDSPTDTSWYGITVNYQIDGNANQDPYTVFLQNVNFTYQ